MQYALLIYEDEAAMQKAEGGPAFHALVERHIAFSGNLKARNIQTGGAGLKATSSATTVRAAGKLRTVHDGPFAETKEQLGGLYMIDVQDLDAAISIAKQLPLHGDAGCVEIRPLLGAG